MKIEEGEREDTWIDKYSKKVLLCKAPTTKREGTHLPGGNSSPKPRWIHPTPIPSLGSRSLTLPFKGISHDE